MCLAFGYYACAFAQSPAPICHKSLPARVSVFKVTADLHWLPRLVLPGGHFCSSRQNRYFSRGTGEQTLSAELASAPQVKQETVGLSVRCAISLVNPWLFRMHRWPLWLSPQLQLMLDPMSLSSLVLLSLLSIAVRRRYEANLLLLHRPHRLLSAYLTDDELHSSYPYLPASRYALYAFLRRCIVCYLPFHRSFSASTSFIESLPARYPAAFDFLLLQSRPIQRPILRGQFDRTNDGIGLNS
ncbi:MAG: hypothetical protein H6Q56_1430 [Deltaproteobacteria bacterium]|nr:hypothetical protein [Deltaproteobacteria bacterium]